MEDLQVNLDTPPNILNETIVDTNITFCKFTNGAVGVDIIKNTFSSGICRTVKLDGWYKGYDIFLPKL
jgi:hypothetical protein